MEPGDAARAVAEADEREIEVRSARLVELNSILDVVGRPRSDGAVEAYAEDVFPDSLITEVVQVLGDLGQHTAALILNDKMVHVTR